MCDGMQTSEQKLHVSGQIQGIGNDDIVEAFGKVQRLPGLHVKLSLGHAPPGGGNLPGAKIHAYLADRMQAGQQFAGTAANLQY